MSVLSFNSFDSCSSTNSLSEEIQFLQKIGQGAFGQVYKAKLPNCPKEYAIKLEYIDDHFDPLEHLQIKQEYAAYKIFESSQKALSTSMKKVNPNSKLSPTNILAGIPNAYCFKQFQEGEYMLVMDLLGPSLDYLFRLCNKRFTPKTVAMLAIQMITRVEFLHKCNIVHQDIKPSNFVMGNKNHSQSQDTVYIIDFGLSKSFKTQENEHIQMTNGHSLIGNARFASLNNHTGISQSRRDDLESLGYIFAYFLTGTLPWVGNYDQMLEEDMFNAIFKKKLATNSKQFSFEGVPQAFQQYIAYCRKLGFYDTPDYSFLRNLMLDFMRKNQYEMDFKFDWLEVCSDFQQIETYKEKAKRLEAQKLQNINNINIVDQVKKEFQCKTYQNPIFNKEITTSFEKISCPQQKRKTKKNVFVRIFNDFFKKVEESDYDWLVIADKMAQEIFGNQENIKNNKQSNSQDLQINKIHMQNNNNNNSSFNHQFS